jgi:hypothetical protein
MADKERKEAVKVPTATELLERAEGQMVVPHTGSYSRRETGAAYRVAQGVKEEEKKVVSEEIKTR